jgi:hypothetical protein
MALFAKFEMPSAAKTAKVEKEAPPTIEPSHVSQLSQERQSEIISISPPLLSSSTTNRGAPRAPCYCCKGTDYWMGGTEKYPHWICRKCHPPAPGAESEIKS